MKYILSPFRVSYKIYFLTAFSLSLALMYPVFKFCLIRKSRFPLAFKAMRFWAHALQIFALSPIRVTWKGQLPQNTPYIVCPNHSSFMDIQCLYIILKDYFIFTGKKEIEKWPLFHIFYTSGMNITVDRKSRIGAYRAFKRMEKELEAGNPILIFPEGTISKSAPLMGDFKEGAFSLAIQAQVPVVPVTFTTNWKRLQRKSFFSGLAGPGIAEAIIHEPVDTKGMTPDDVSMLAKKVKSIIEVPLVERYGNVITDKISQ